MTMINFKGKNYELKEIGYREYRKLIKTRDVAIQSNDEDKILDSLELWMKSTTNITDIDLDVFSLADAIKFSIEIGKAQTLPLQQNNTMPASS